MQISLAHGFGDGKAESCGYARDAVSRLLQGENIDFYLAMSLDGISALNDLAGGVTVTLEDDFSAADPAMTRGTTLTLHGDQAEIFVRRRMDIGEGTNEARMVRQEEYLAQLSAQLESRVRQDQQFTAQVYDALQPYLVTDLAKSVSAVSSLALTFTSLTMPRTPVTVAEPLALTSSATVLLGVAARTDTPIPTTIAAVSATLITFFIVKTPFTSSRTPKMLLSIANVFQHSHHSSTGSQNSARTAFWMESSAG